MKEILMGPWLFRVVDVLIGPTTTIVLELQRQIAEGGSLDGRLLTSVAIGAVLQVLWHVQRAGTERAQRKAEVASGENADADPQVETNP